MAWLRACGAAAVLAIGSLALADGEAEVMVLKVGQKVDFRPGFFPAQSTCDDWSVIRLEDAGDHFVISARAPGKTLCGFSSVAPSGRRRLLELIVKP
jgi:hypothetical protein